MSKPQRRSLTEAVDTKDRSHNPLAEEMKREAATVTEPVKQIHVYTPLSLHRAFKVKTTVEGKSMNEVLVNFIQGYIKD